MSGGGSSGRGDVRDVAGLVTAASVLILSLSSITSRCAPFTPMPGTLVSAGMFSDAIAARRASGLSTETTA